MFCCAVTAPYRRSEILLAQSLTASIPDNSVTLFDSADLLLMLNLQGNDRHWLLPARKKNPSLPKFWYARAVTYELNGVEKTVLTSLPADRFKEKRWQSFTTRGGKSRSSSET